MNNKKYQLLISLKEIYFILIILCIINIFIIVLSVFTLIEESIASMQSYMYIYIILFLVFSIGIVFLVKTIQIHRSLLKNGKIFQATIIDFGFEKEKKVSFKYEIYWKNKPMEFETIRTRNKKTLKDMNIGDKVYIAFDEIKNVSCPVVEIK